MCQLVASIRIRDPLMQRAQTPLYRDIGKVVKTSFFRIHSTGHQMLSGDRAQVILSYLLSIENNRHRSSLMNQQLDLGEIIFQHGDSLRRAICIINIRRSFLAIGVDRNL